MNTTLSSITYPCRRSVPRWSQGLAVAEETINQLNAAAQQAQVNAENVKSQAQDMTTCFKKPTEQGDASHQLSEYQPNNIATDPSLRFTDRLPVH